MKLAPFGFDNPFTRAHCVPLAFTCVGPKPSAKFAVILADSAYGRVHPALWDCRLLKRSGGAPAAKLAVDEWARLALVRIVERYEPDDTLTIGYRGGREVYKRVGRPTVTQFRKGRGRRGRWVVFTDGHAQAVINGKVRGWFGARSRVVAAFRVEVL